MPDFTEDFKVSIIVDATQVDKKVKESRAKLNAFRKAESQKAQINLRVNIAQLETKLTKARAELRRFKKEGNESAQISAQLKIKGLQDQKRLANKALRDIQKQAEKTTKSFFSLNGIVRDGIKAFGGFLIIRKFGQALRGAFDASISFESAFAGVRKTVDASEAEFTALEKGFRALAKTIPVTVEELLKIGELGGQLGIAQQDLLEFTETIAEVAVATNLTSEEAATALARIANIFEEPIENVENFASAVVELGNNFATTETEIVNFATRIAGIGSAIGLTTSDIAAIGTAFTSVGVQAEAGGTAVQKTLITINDAVIGGGKDLERFASVAGKSAKEFADIWKSAPVQAFDLFVQGLGKSGSEASTILDELVGSDARLKRAFLGLAQSGDILTRSIATSTVAFAQNNALSEEAAKRFATNESRLALLRARWNDLAITVGDFLVSAVIPTLEFFTDLTEAFLAGEGRLAGLAKVIKLAGTALTTAFSISIIKKIATGIGSLSGQLQIFNTRMQASVATGRVLGGSSGVLATIGKRLLSVTSVTTLAVVGVTALVFAWMEAREEAERLDQATANLNTTLGELSGTYLGVSQFANSFTESIEKLRVANEDLNNFSFSGNALKAQDDYKAKLQQSGQALSQLRRDTVELLESLGATKEEISETTSQLSFFRGASKASTKDVETFEKAVSKLTPELDRLSSRFRKLVKEFQKGGATLEDAVEEAVKSQAKEWETAGLNVDDFAKSSKNTLVTAAAETEGIGSAYNIGWRLGFTKEEIETLGSVQSLSDDGLLILLNGAVQAGKNGEATGLLYALGIITNANEAQAIRSSTNLAKSVQNAFDGAQDEIFGSGQGAGQSLVSGVISGIKQRIPALGVLLEGLIGTLGAFQGLGGAFAPILQSVPLVQSVFGKLESRVDSLRGSWEDLQNVASDPAPFRPSGGGGGGGGGGALREAEKESKALAKELKEVEKRSKEARSAIDGFKNAIDAANDASRDLRDDIRDFYQDIVDSVDEAKQAQEDLNDELKDFTAEERKSFATDTGEKDLELAEEEKEIREEIKELSEAQIEDEEDRTRNLEEQEKLENELNKILQERKQIQDFLATDEGLKVLEDFQKARERAALTEFEQDRLALEDRIGNKEKEVDAEIAKQQKIIDVQQRFLKLQEGNDAKSLKIKKSLIDLATTDEILSAEQRAEKLAELGFRDLDDEQVANLLGQIATVNALDEEFKLIQAQQEDILRERQKFLALTEQAFSDSVARQIVKQDELITKIEDAIALQDRLRSFGGNEAAAQAVQQSQTVNIENTINSNVDFEAGLNNLVNKIK